MRIAIKKSFKSVCFVATGLSVFATANIFAADARSPNAINSATFRLADVKDIALCQQVSVENIKGKIEVRFPKQISNPAATCPDTYSWIVFLKGIESQFWQNWAYDSYTWPQKPYPLCKEGDTSNSQCCSINSNNNPGYDNQKNPGKNCPYYPGDHANPVLGLTQPSLKQRSGHPSNINFKTADDKQDPGREIRQAMAEVVYRNKPMWSYIFQNDLYNTDGLANMFNAANTEMSQDAPYRVSKVNGISPKVNFPQESVMFKGDWLHEEYMKQIFPNFDPIRAQKEYVTMVMTSSTGDNDAGRFKPGLHYLVAMTMGSKDLPNWLWFAIEHKDNLGRCDYTGCNDSFGYRSIPPKNIANVIPNYTEPHYKDDGLVSSADIFVTGLPYPGGTINPKLAEIMDTMGIGLKPDNNPKMPSIGDPAWKNYRLKGSQSQYINNYGEPTILGNSVTEGGFVMTSSCLTCHVRASVNNQGNPGNGGGFVPVVDVIGYPQSPNGAPNPAWFMNYTENPDLLSAQFDFVWGILFAKPLVK